MSNAATDNTPAILQARQEFLSNGSVEQGAIAEAIERSWRRCLANGIDTNSPQSLEVVTAQELALKREKNQQLLKLAQPEMETLNEQIAHTRNVVILTDDEGVILHSLGGHHFLNEEQRIALSAGASWNENHRGTNAIGTVLIEQSALTVQGAEHFMAYHHSLSCSAVPIFGAENQLIATLDVSNDFNMSQQHTLALVKMSAQMIENRLFMASHKGEIALHFHARPEFIGTLWEGVAIFTDSGQLVATNRSGQFQLSLNTSNTASQQAINFNNLFDVPFASLLRQVGSTDKLIVPLRLNNGARIYVQMEPLNKKPQISTTPPATVKRTSAANLDLLDSGDAKISRAVQQIKQVLSRDIPILIQGETGVGKELFARAIHEASAQHKGPWVAVNCAALPEGLIEAELFGYEEGAFTGARRKGSPGKIEQANGGTLFLDEIGDMPLSLQARLLRVLQERTVTPLGSTKTIPVNFSLISATNLKLKEKVESGEFRSDLYYRLNGLSVALPPLRERSDLQALIDVILNIEQAGAIEITPEVRAIFQAHTWPGNIRQLHNVLRTALALADGAAISTLHLTQDFIDEMSLSKPSLIANVATANPVDLDDLTNQAIRRAMQTEAGNVSAVARQLGISRNTLYRKLKTMGIA
ncbi:sigma-54-dependent Fis family transcriptional regulator [Methylotenera mobilis]|uniref:GAF modulated sigma54 specific transcriptional regulator, Fis family n=1 Tax=Methylotenera mobilis (strain JLW8 / ATCC BAA-1282 / DSM 17540) TaxID=583345 RepID=C6WXM6_METML|nr:sigma-54-dependent Fis family transcriptional regulator [Methylotenera mobilis]ACT48675.1 GAF modulated sigma54 specific transcriptional regulator, Fis family [Methylotenera mobilis JLW8]